jgi:uncharacterized surface protein with fasciclin (FAS1) repeats
MKKFRTLMTVTGFFLATFAYADDTPPAQPVPSNDIVDTVVATGRFMTLARALQAAGLVETLKGPGPFTVFAPNDQAFAKLPPGKLDALLKDPEGLKKILLRHVVSGTITSKDIAAQKSVKTEAGANISVHVTESGAIVVGRAKVIQPDVLASNGVVHVIDAVLIPAPPAPKPAVSPSSKPAAAPTKIQ